MWRTTSGFRGVPQKKWNLQARWSCLKLVDTCYFLLSEPNIFVYISIYMDTSLSKRWSFAGQLKNPIFLWTPGVRLFLFIFFLIKKNNLWVFKPLLYIHQRSEPKFSSNSFPGPRNSMLNRGMSKTDGHWRTAYIDLNIIK